MRPKYELENRLEFDGGGKLLEADRGGVTAEDARDPGGQG